MANPDPEITAEEVAAVRDDAIMATGRSDYPNQVNNVLGFPYIFRGALDVRATTINMEMKIAAARALADLAREDVPDEVAAAYGARPKFGPDYIIPVPFDPRLIFYVPPAVAKAAMDTGVARQDRSSTWTPTASNCNARRDPVAGTMVQVFARSAAPAKRVVFAEGEEEQVIRAAASFVHQGLGTALLCGREDRVKAAAKEAGIELGEGIEIINAALSKRNTVYLNYLYERLQRRGYLLRDCQRLVNTDRNYFAACMVALGDADAMVTGVTRNFSVALEDVRNVIDPKPGHRVIGVSLVVARGRTVLVADTAVTEMPTAEELAEIAIEAAGVARRHGLRAAACAARLLHLRQPQGRTFGEGDRGGARFSTTSASISNTTATWPPTLHSIRSLPRPTPSAGCRARQCAGDAGVPLGLHLDQDAAGTRRRDRHRPAAGRSRPAGADRAARRQGHPAGQHGGAWRRIM